MPRSAAAASPNRCPSLAFAVEDNKPDHLRPVQGESAEQQQQNAPPPDQHQQQHHLGEVEVPPGRGAPHGLTISPDNSDPVRVTDYYPGDLVAGDEAHLGESGDDSNASQAPGGGGSGGGHVKFGTNPAEGGPVHDVVFDPVRGISIGPVADHAGAVYEASQPGGRGVRRRNPLIIHSPREPARHGDSSTDAANAAGCVHHSHGDHGGAAPAAAVQTDLPAGVGSTTVDDADAADRGSGSTPPSDPAAREGRSGGGGGTSGLAHVGVTAVKNFVGESSFKRLCLSVQAGYRVIVATTRQFCNTYPRCQELCL